MIRVTPGAIRKTLAQYQRFLHTYQALRPEQMHVFMFTGQQTVIETWHSYALIRIRGERFLRLIHTLRPDLTLALITATGSRFEKYAVSTAYRAEEGTKGFIIERPGSVNHTHITRTGAFHQAAREFHRSIVAESRRRRRLFARHRNSRNRDTTTEKNARRLLYG